MKRRATGERYSFFYAEHIAESLEQHFDRIDIDNRHFQAWQRQSIGITNGYRVNVFGGSEVYRAA